MITEKREYIRIEEKKIDRNLIQKLKNVFFYFNSIGKKIHLPVQKISHDPHGRLYASFIIPPKIPFQLLQKLPETFFAASLIQDYNDVTGKPQRKLAKIGLKKSVLRENLFIAHIQEILIAKYGRKFERLKNLSQDIYARKFIVNSEVLDIERKKPLFSGVFQNARIMLAGQFSDVRVDFFSRHMEPALELVRNTGQPLWINTEMPPADSHKKEIWHWDNREFVFLNKSDLENYTQEEAEIDDILKETQKKGSSLSPFQNKSELIFPIFFKQSGANYQVGYIHILSTKPISRNHFARIERQLLWLEQALSQGKDLKIEAIQKILDFNILGARLEITHDDLKTNLQLGHDFFFDFCIDYEQNDTYNIKSRVMFISPKKSGKWEMGVKFLHFEPISNGKGDFLESKPMFLKAIQNYKQEYKQS